MVSKSRAGAGDRAESGKVLEHGDIFFFYHPKAGRALVSGLEDVASFHMLLHPLNVDRYRYAAIGLKGILGPIRKAPPNGGPEWSRWKGTPSESGASLRPRLPWPRRGLAGKGCTPSPSTAGIPT